MGYGALKGLTNPTQFQPFTDYDSNIALGEQAGAILTKGHDNMYIGNNGGAAIETGKIRIGTKDTHTDAFVAGIYQRTTGNTTTLPVIVDQFGQLGTAPSSERFKTEIKPMDQTSEAVLGLKPVTFQYKSDSKGAPQYGLIAEEVAQVNPDLVVHDEKGEIYSVRYDAVSAMLLNEFLKQHRKVETLEARASQQQQEIAALTATLKEQSAQIKKVSTQIEMNKLSPQVADNSR